jgi:hypothetical protein
VRDRELQERKMSRTKSKFALISKLNRNQRILVVFKGHFVYGN